MKTATQDSVEDMAPLLFGGWTPSAEQRRTAEHFGNTEDVFDLLDIPDKGVPSDKMRAKS